ncbi:hypothetical protein NLX67_17110 [Domibacillus sp. A3M-37]|nr:hypothetical protein [Domibacillus sp. A3M-37]
MKTMKEQLRQWTKVNGMPIEKKKTQKQKPKKKQPEKKQEKMSDRELQHLMNTNMRTLKRGRGGAYK